MHFLTVYRRLFSAMWSALKAEEVKPLFGLVFLIALLGATVFRILEDWSFLDSLYFSIVTMATVGYGDLAPDTLLGKTAAVIFMFCGIGVFVLAICTFAQAFLREISIEERNREDRQDGSPRPRDGSADPSSAPLKAGPSRSVGRDHAHESDRPDLRL